RGGVVRKGQGSATVTIEWTNLNQQSLTVIPTNPCGEGIAMEKPIMVLTAPSRPSEIDGPSLVGIEEADYSIDAVPDVNYQWSTGPGGTILSGQGTGTVRVKWEHEGNFELAVTPMNGCDD